jgi:hypothetical protein
MRSLFRVAQFGILGSLLTVLTATAFASDSACMAGNQVMPLNNQQVLAWKFNPSVPSGMKSRANVTGVVLGIFPDRNGHNHFIIQIGPRPVQDTLEVVYNNDFGDLPTIQQGMQVHACGDFIKSTQQNGPYPPSPAGAIVHWVHQNPNGNGHENGYLTIDNVMYGNGPDRGHAPQFGGNRRQGDRRQNNGWHH